MVPAAGASVVGAGVLIAAFLGTHADAVRAVADSVNPGARRGAGGTGSLRVLLAAPFDTIAARTSAAHPVVNGVKQTEAADGAFLLAAIAAAEADRTAWNRYANALWGVAPEGVAPRVFLETQDTVIVIVDPCDPTLARLGVGTVVSRVPLARACLVPVDRVRAGTGPGTEPLYVSRIDRRTGTDPSG